MKNWSKLLKKTWKQYKKWILLGLAIRLFLMPFFTHSDLLSVYKRGYLSLQSGSFIPFSIDKLHALFLLIIKPFLSGITIFWQADTIISFDPGHWFNFISNPNIFRILFFLKLPYLFFDALAFLALAKLTEDTAFQKQSVLFWLFNPVVIFATYIFGRHDIITIFIILLAIYSFKNRKLYFSFALIALASVYRYYPIFILPAFILMIEPAKRFKTAVYGLSTLVLFWAVSSSFTWPFALRTAKLLRVVDPRRYPFLLQLNILGTDVIYIFVVGFALLIIYIYLTKKPSYENLIKSCLAILMVYFAFGFFHPHYFIWVVPFIALLVTDKKLLYLYWWQVAFWAVIILRWGNPLNTYLAMPVSPNYFKYLSFIAPSTNLYYVTAISRSIFTAIAIALIFLLLTQRETDEPETA